VEAGVSVGTACRSHGPALFAFGGKFDRAAFGGGRALPFRFELNEARAARIAGLVGLNSILNFPAHLMETVR
jgi:hypothetical protein